MHNDPFDDPFRIQAGPATPDIFRRPRSGGVARSRKPDGASDAAAGSEAEPLAPEDQEEPVATPEAVENPADKVTLRNPKWEREVVGFNEETEISVEAELPESQAHKTRVEFELFAETPNGPESISKGQGNIQSGRAVCKIPVYIPHFKDEFGNLLDKVKYFFTARHSASDPLKDEAVTKEIKELADRLLACHILQDITFAPGRSQVSPKHAPALKAMVSRIWDWRKRYPDGKLAVFGHADAVGREDRNKKLSERRAQAIFAFLAKDADIWKALCDEEKWGLASTQELLKHLGHDPGAIDGKDGPKTQAAVKAFQGKQGLPTSGSADAATRKALYAAFMGDCNPKALTAKDFDSLDGQPFAGCSEFNLVEKVDGSNEANRRVAVVLLKSNRNFPIHYPCKQGDIAPCKKQVGRKGERRTAGFGCLFYDQLVVESGGREGSQNHLGKLKLLGIQAGETIKQYVNLNPGKPEEGSERLIEVEVEDAPDGTKIFWRAISGKNNSKRSSPQPGLKANANAELIGFSNGTSKLATEVKSGKASAILVCGLAGGDEFVIEFGFESKQNAISFKIVTWRRLGFETIQPEAGGKDPITGFTFFTPDKTPGLSRQSKEYLDRTLGECFVEIDQIHGSKFTRADLPRSGIFNVFDGAYAGKDAGKPFCILTLSQLFRVLLDKAQLRSDRRSVSVIWADYLAEVVKWEESYGEISKGQIVETKAAVFENTIDDFGSIPHGACSIERLSWRVSHWMDYELGEWKPIKSPKDPGWEFRNGGTLVSPEDIRAHVKFRGMHQLELDFPDSGAQFPARVIGLDETGRFIHNGIYLALKITLVGAACSATFNGLALEGNIWMNTFAGEVHDIGVAGVIAHELGHNMGQAYADTKVAGKFGRPQAKAIPGIPFPKGVPEGDVYSGRGHQGAHCAKGVKNKSASKYSDLRISNAINEHACIMFGGSDMFDSTEFTFCSDCSKYIRAEDLHDIRKSWR